MALITLSNGTSFDAARGESVLDAALAKGIVLEHSCRTGRCGSCKARATRGETAVLRDPVGLMPQDADRGWVLTCAYEAVSDVHLDIEDLGALVGIQTRVSPARIAAIEPLAEDVVRVELRLPPRSPFRFLAGQYLDVTSPAGVKRSYSIASASATPDKVELQIRRVDGGALSAYWFGQAKVNDLLRFNGPLGTFFLRPVAGLDLVFLATGTGIAPILSMLRQLSVMPADDQPRSVTLYWGGRHREDHYLDPRSAFEGLRYVPVVSRGDTEWAGARGHVQDVFVHEVAHRQASALAESAVYACGSEAMIHGARHLLSDAGLPARRFFFDAFVSSN
jgi:CDP-4-dehydro-6-deoxyglucose reductase